ncbi:hypothetical protein [Mucilaginibacter psychrotolerans]|uniref:Uncharacterized protein n=1 Tax=Mucilaginibacter psychrotolerans TaxID=1524096 RepID=A0A4Y8SND9_9SPHI|nr:hypothetical protein [Mucilaginibacter psychrotolerans]TFF40161.1 hypothetical protein E2R66_02595 [Mucilaginibacter psychrotolerans]
MKPLIKYISLLMFSGLILPFCDLKFQQAQRFLFLQKAAQSIKAQPQKPAVQGVLLCREVLETLFPVLKSEKSM